MKIILSFETIVPFQERQTLEFLEKIKELYKKDYSGRRVPKMEISTKDDDKKICRDFIIDCMTLTKKRIDTLYYKHCILYESEKLVSLTLFWVIVKGRTKILNQLGNGNKEVGLKMINKIFDEMVISEEIEFVSYNKVESLSRSRAKFIRLNLGK